jgi:hypothetical protein
MVSGTKASNKTAQELLAALTAKGLDFCSTDEFDVFRSRCPTCNGSGLMIHVDESDGFELECPSLDCTPEGIVDAVFAPPNPKPELAEPNPPTFVPADPPVSKPVVPPASAPLLESCGHGVLGVHGVPVTHGLMGLLGLPDNRALDRAIHETIPEEPRETKKKPAQPVTANSVAFPFARHVKSIIGDQEMSGELLQTLESAAARWHETASQLFENQNLLPDAGEFAEEVATCFVDAKTSVDQSRLYVATQRARETPYQDERLTEPHHEVLAALCFNLAEVNGGEFFLSEKRAAGAANVAKRTAKLALVRLQMLRLIVMVKKGSNEKLQKRKPGEPRPKRDATTYRWLGPVEPTHTGIER